MKKIIACLLVGFLLLGCLSAYSVDDWDEYYWEDLNNWYGDYDWYDGYDFYEDYPAYDYWDEDYDDFGFVGDTYYNSDYFLTFDWSEDGSIFINSVQPYRYDKITGEPVDILTFELPAAFEGIPVGGIGESCFDGWTFEKIVIPSSVKEIDAMPFSGCFNLKEIVVDPENPYFEVIGGVLYEKNTGRLICASYDAAITEVVIPEGTKIIDYAGLAYLESLESVTIPASLEKIDEYAFYGDISLESINVASESEFFKTKDNALFEKKNGTLVAVAQAAISSDYEVPEGTKNIGNGAFYSCEKLERVTLPASVETISYAAFSYCNNLKEVSLNYGLKKIEDFAFSDCYRLKEIFVPATVTKLGDAAFSQCVSLERAFLLSKASVSDSLFEFCYNLKSVYLEEGIDWIGNSAFFCCYRLESIKLPSSVDSIGMGAFESCSSLEEMVIPAKVGFIGDSAFNNCVNLESVCVGEGMSELDLAVFYGCYALQTIQVASADTEIVLTKDVSLHPDVRFEGLAGSKAEQFAVENGADFVLIENF